MVFWEHKPHDWINLERVSRVVYERSTVADPNPVVAYVRRGSPTIRHRLTIEIPGEQAIEMDDRARIVELAGLLGIRDPTAAPSP